MNIFSRSKLCSYFFFQAEDGIRDVAVTEVQTCALPICRLNYKAQPVPPIFEPEVGAKAVVWAADHRRREMYVGGSTVEAIVGNKVAPGLLDEYLGRTG